MKRTTIKPLESGILLLLLAFAMFAFLTGCSAKAGQADLRAEAAKLCADHGGVAGVTSVTPIDPHYWVQCVDDQSFPVDDKLVVDAVASHDFDILLMAFGGEE